VPVSIERTSAAFASATESREDMMQSTEKNKKYLFCKADLRVGLLAPALLTLLLSACAAPMAGNGPRSAAQPVEIGIAAFNDFHGNLEQPRQPVAAPDGNGGTVQVPAGGAAWFAAALDSIRAKYAHNLTVSAGDMISASPLASSLYLDEPTIGVMNRLGLDFNAVGNHEFDRGREELLRLQSGGCAKLTAKQPCQLEPFKGASFRYLAASTQLPGGQTLFPGSALRTFGKGKRQVKVGLIGLTLKGTKDLVDAARIAGLTFADEAATINAELPRLKAAGADAIVVLIHEGGKTTGAPDPQGCAGLAGGIRPILDALDPGVDVVVSGHTHWDYICDYPGRDPARPLLLTSAGFYGREITDITLAIDPAAHRVVARRARNVIVQSEPFTSARRPVSATALFPQFTPRADIAAYVKTYVDASKELAARPVGKLSGPASRGEGALASTGGTLGNLIADAQLVATRNAGAQIAFTNPFGNRAPIVPAADGSVSFGSIYLAQPFGNRLITKTMTGAEIRATLEQGLDGTRPEQVLAPSKGLAFRFDRTRPAGDRIVSITLDGVPLDPAARLRVTINSFLASGGDGFTGFAGKPEAVTGPVDLEALEAYLSGTDRREVPLESRAGPVGP
jgi:5'-nucleotidase